MPTRLLEAEATHRRIDTDVNREDVPVAEDTDPDRVSDVPEVVAVDHIRDLLIEIGELQEAEVPLQTVRMPLLKNSTAFTVPFPRTQSQTASITFCSNTRTCCLNARLVSDTYIVFNYFGFASVIVFFLFVCTLRFRCLHLLIYVLDMDEF
jgi:hypothetical protein